MKDFLKKLIEKRKAQYEELKKKMKGSSDAEEVRGLGETLIALKDEIADAESQLSALDEEAPVEASKDEEGAERKLNPLASYGMKQVNAEKKSDSVYGTLEYRKAFKDFVQRGTPIPAEYRAGGDTGTTVTADIGAIVPETIMQEFIKDVSKVYGNIYAKVRKLNIKGGVKFPISELSARFRWVTETTVSQKQKAGDIKTYITFEYNIGEIRVAQSLLSQVVSLDMFESEIVKIMMEAYVEAMDKGIISGDGNGQLLGIINDPRVTNVVEFTEAEFADWTKWRKKLFSVVPLSKRGQGEFLFPPSTVESYLMTMKDANDRPLFKEATDLDLGNTSGSFFGRTVDLVEPDVIADFDTAEDGDVIGIFWTPNDYAINTNMEFGMKRWFDEDTNEWINKGLTIVDGKMLDTSGCYLLKKKVVEEVIDEPLEP